MYVYTKMRRMLDMGCRDIDHPGMAPVPTDGP